MTTIAGALIVGPAISMASPAPELRAPNPPEDSVSWGDTSTGRLLHGVRLRESEALGILPVQKMRNYRYGTRELVGMLEHAATTLHDATGTRMWVGHLSRRGGGNIRHSVSHNSGRDADIAFAYRDKRGKPVDPRWLIPVYRSGRARQAGVYFDAPRSWQIIKALIAYEGAQVQYLFVSRAIEGRVLRHARRIGEPWVVRAVAARIMVQPGGRAGPHHDHIHLRLYCSRDDVAAGCVNTGRRHPWAKMYYAERARYLREQYLKKRARRRARAARRKRRR